MGNKKSKPSEDLCKNQRIIADNHTRTMVYDVIVVGGGVMGCAAAYILSKQGKKTLLIEQFPLPHTRGSSHGASRITRKGYADPFNANIMNEAFPMWDTLAKESGIELFKQTGMLCFANEDLEFVYKYHTTIQSYVNKDIELLDQKKLKENYPLMSFEDPKTVGCLDESAGTLFADKCLQAFQKVFVANGGTIADMCKVKAIIPGDTVGIETSKGLFRAHGVILTCGAWTSKILSTVGLALPLEPQAIQVCYWKTKSGVDHSKMPCFINFPYGTHIYGLPALEYDGLVKAALHHGAPCDPDSRDLVDPESEAKDLETLKEFVAQTLPYLHPEPAVKERCMYTLTPDKNCIVDVHPQYKNIVYGAGFSGTGFKQAPVIGSILSDLVQGKTHRLHAPEMKACRFNRTSKL